MHPGVVRTNTLRKPLFWGFRPQPGVAVDSAAAGTTALAAALSSLRGHIVGSLRIQHSAASVRFTPFKSHGSRRLCTVRRRKKMQYHGAFSGQDLDGIVPHSATLAGQGKATQLTCAPPSHTVLAESAGKVQCHGDGNCGFYTVPLVPGLERSAHPRFQLFTRGHELCFLLMRKWLRQGTSAMTLAGYNLALLRAAATRLLLAVVSYQDTAPTR